MRYDIPAKVDELTTEFEYEANFTRGQEPDWIFSDVIGGGSVNYQTDNGGRAKIDTGTSSTGDGGNLRFGNSGSGVVPIDLDGIDVFVCSCLVEMDTDDGSVARGATNISQASDQFQIKRTFSLIRVIGDSTTDYNTPDKDWSSNAIRTTFVFDIRNNEAYTITGGMISEVATSDLPDVSADEFFVSLLKFTTQDTTSNRTAYLYHANVSGFSRR